MTTTTTTITTTTTTTYAAAAPLMTSALYDTLGVDIFAADDSGEWVAWLPAADVPDVQVWTDADVSGWSEADADAVLAAAGYRRLTPWGLGADHIVYTTVATGA